MSGLQRTHGPYQIWFCRKTVTGFTDLRGEKKNRRKPPAALVFSDSHSPSVLSLKRWLLLRCNLCCSHGVKAGRWTSAPKQHVCVLTCCRLLRPLLFRFYWSKCNPVPGDCCISSKVPNSSFLAPPLLSPLTPSVTKAALSLETRRRSKRNSSGIEKGTHRVCCIGLH